MNKYTTHLYAGLLFATGYIGLGLYLDIPFRFSLIGIILGIVASEIFQFAFSVKDGVDKE